MEALRALGYQFILYCDDILVATKETTASTAVPTRKIFEVWEVLVTINLILY
jgi:hypothetical protein